MQLTIEIDDKLAQEFFSLVPEKKRSFYVSELLASHLSFKKKIETSDIKKGNERKLPFEVLPARGTMGTNELINQIREQEGV
ncbi:hypothetical protein LU290_09260 [Moraxella nasibovis]|uniref:hypothetical protein n=1 Tax=Moraxella nasibovis TaxID=2904120 RepID=UPI00240FA4BA|nr:hypothetical protein [Moraxella nasibovis]WFF38424.1 hypothetical protein LU290_09260 [Moraxella nasibovis]